MLSKKLLADATATESINDKLSSDRDKANLRFSCLVCVFVVVRFVIIVDDDSIDDAAFCSYKKFEAEYRLFVY